MHGTLIRQDGGPTRWYRLLRPIMRHFRRARAKRIVAHFPFIGAMNVLDVGGSLHFWDAVGDLLTPRSLTILNVTGDDTADAAHTGGPILFYDGHTIPFPDQSIDLVICNSVVEHVPAAERQRLACEIRRVAVHYVIQTPAFEFPFEPHLAAPFVHWLPRPIGRALARLAPRALASGRSVTEVFDEVSLLRAPELIALFPGSALTVERFCAWPKSYLAIG